MKKIKILIYSLFTLIPVTTMLINSCIVPFTLHVRSDYLKDDTHQLKQHKPLTISKNKKHYIYLMVDSLTSWKLLDSIKRLEQYRDKFTPIGNAPISKSDSEMINKKLDVFNEFELKMNVITPGYRTDKGFEGIIGGAYGQYSTAYFSRATNSRKDMLNATYNRMFKSIGMSNQIDKIYPNATAFYIVGEQHDISNQWTLDDVNIPEQAKNKMDLSARISGLKNQNEFYKSIEQIDENKNTFTLLASDVVHDPRDAIYTYGNPKNNNDNTLFHLMSNMKNILVKKGIWEDTEIMIVSDHGVDITYRMKHPNGFYFKKQNNQKIKLIDNNRTLNNDNIKFHNTNENIDAFETGLLHAQSAILYKPIKSTHKKMQIDYDNLYINSDAISQLYYDMGIDPYYIEFNYYNYMKDLKNKTNKNGDYNSYVNDPFHKDLSKRRLFTLDAKQPGLWGYYDWPHTIKTGTLFNGPWWSSNSNNISFNASRIKKIRIDNQPDGEKSWLSDKRDQIAKKTRNGGKTLDVMGNVLNSINKYLEDQNK